jgi:hypothetical protein
MPGLISYATLWTLAAAFVAVGMEYLYKTLPGEWSDYLWIWVPGALFVNYSIYRLVSLPGTPLIGALVLWSFATIVTRTLVSALILREHIAPGVWCAVALVFLARIVQNTWR